MIGKLVAESLNSFVATILASIPPNIIRKKIERNEDAKDIFIALVKSVPEWMLEIDEAVWEEARKLAGSITYREIVLAIYKSAPWWFNSLKDLLLSKKGKEWFERYLIRRLREWFAKGYVEDILPDLARALEERGRYDLAQKVLREARLHRASR